MNSAKLLPFESPRSIRWIPVTERCPSDRRKVLAWGKAGIIFWPERRDAFLGSTRFNAAPTGGKWDVEKTHWSSPYFCSVTHWAEITGPGR